MARGETLNPVRPSAAIREAYEARLTRMIERMARDVERQIAKAYRAKGPELAVYAMDASPARTLRSLIGALSRDWSKRFDGLSGTLAEYFSKQTRDRCDRAIKAEMRKAGLTVRFKATAAMNDAYQAVVGENIGLIKSIPARYFDQVQTLTMQSVASGRDIGHLAKGLQDQLGVTKRRAAFIARDQSNKATAVMTRTRYLEMGVTEAYWLHSEGGKTKRIPHVNFSRQKYSLITGHDFGDGEGYVHPGQLISCRCVPKPIVPGFE